MWKPIACSLVLAFASRDSTAGWMPSRCPAGIEKQQSSFRSVMEKASPGSGVYAPIPFPKTEKEVIADLRFAVVDLLSGKPGIPGEDMRLLQAVQADSAAYEVLAVESWAPERCNPKRLDASYFLVRIFEPASGREFARFALHGNGLPLEWQALPDTVEHVVSEKWRHAIRRASELQPAAEKALSCPLNGAQYVHTEGTLRCPVLEPCVAWKDPSGGVVVHSRGDLYRLEELRIPRGPVAKDPHERERVVRDLRSQGKRLIALGSEEYATLKKVTQIVAP